MVKINEVLLLLTVTLYFVYKQGQENTARRSSILETSILYIPWLQLLAGIILFYEQTSFLQWHKALFLLYFCTMAIVNRVVEDYLKNYEKVMKKRKLYSRLQKQRIQELKYYQEINKSLEDSKILRHEFYNQVQIVEMMMEQGEDNRLIQEMLDKMNQNLKSFH